MSKLTYMEATYNNPRDKVFDVWLENIWVASIFQVVSNSGKTISYEVRLPNRYEKGTLIMKFFYLINAKDYCERFYPFILHREVIQWK